MSIAVLPEKHVLNGHPRCLADVAPDRIVAAVYALLADIGARRFDRAEAHAPMVVNA